MKNKKFTWVQTHKELVKYLLGKEGDQKELIELLKEVGCTLFNDKDAFGNTIDLEEIDPFTFFAYINKYGDEKRLSILKDIAEKLGLSKPEDHYGLPTIHAQNVWFFPYKYERKNNEISRLWDLFYDAVDHSITDEKFADALSIRGTGKASLTAALFYVDPEAYLPINGPAKPYLSKHLSIDINFDSFSDYQRILNQITKKVALPIYKISHESWLWTDKYEKNETKRKQWLELIEHYKTYLKENKYYDEFYKWVAIQQFQDTFDPNAINFASNLKESLSKSKNLLYQNSKGYISKAVRYFPEVVREMFSVLFDESKPLDERIDYFVQKSEELEPKVSEKHGKELNHQQDERTLSFYLTMRYPDRYPLYKNEIYKYLVSQLPGEESKSAGEKFYHYLEIGETLIPSIEDDEALFELVTQNLNEDCYSGEQKWLIFQDILWVNKRNIDTESDRDYWLFQGNPKLFDIKQALKDEALRSWRVNAHKEKIMPGDKIILWASGEQRGCYALAEVESEVHEDSVNEDEIPYYSDDFDDVPFDQVQLRITHNLADKPITKKQIRTVNELSGLKIGNQGTNFSASREEFEALLQLAEQNTGQSKKQQTPVMNYPLNTIFYGPPGTGKTYTTIKRAAEIVAERKIDDYDEAKDIFNQQLGETIEFITFHQNYSYEDFIQGLRPDTENDTDLTFNRVDGLFKTIADKALINFRASKSPQTKKNDFDVVFQKFISPLVDGEVEEIEVERKRVLYFITNVTERSIEFRKASGTSSHTLSIRTLNKMYNSESLMNIQGLSGYYSPLLDKLLEMGKMPGITETVESKNYVLIIDEINRANISRVFGELITLIEPDKRYGRDMHIPAKLPSGESFSVPENLYILGTMNTADKSIAQLDIALRRRFEFEAMYPLYELPEKEIYDDDVLRSINKKIIELKGHDFQIGHSYFMDGDSKWSLKKQMNKKVIPLLMEYFMNDEQEVKDVLNSAGLDIIEGSWPLRISGKQS